LRGTHQRTAGRAVALHFNTIDSFRKGFTLDPAED